MGLFSGLGKLFYESASQEGSVADKIGSFLCGMDGNSTDNQLPENIGELLQEESSLRERIDDDWEFRRFMQFCMEEGVRCTRIRRDLPFKPEEPKYEFLTKTTWVQRSFKVGNQWQSRSVPRMERVMTPSSKMKKEKYDRMIDVYAKRRVQLNRRGFWVNSGPIEEQDAHNSSFQAYFLRIKEAESPEYKAF